MGRYRSASMVGTAKHAAARPRSPRRREKARQVGGQNRLPQPSIRRWLADQLSRNPNLECVDNTGANHGQISASTVSCAPSRRGPPPPPLPHRNPPILPFPPCHRNPAL